jgi:hypothetical protein
MCSRDRAGPVDRAPLVHGVQQNVECLMAAYNRCHLAFGAPTRDAMNGEIKLIQGVLGLNTQDGVDKILNTPIINDGSNGKLILLLINIEEPSKLKPIIHFSSKRMDKSTFMAAKHKTLAGNRTSDQSRALEKMICRMQRANGLKGYQNGLALLTVKERRENGLLGYKKSLALIPKKQQRANGLLGYKKSLALIPNKQQRANRSLGYMNGLGSLPKERRCPPPTITKDGMHDLVLDDVVVQANFGTGIVISVQKPVKNLGAKAVVIFEDKQIGSQCVTINSLSCKGQRCQFAFVWNAYDKQWMGMYQKLVAYKKQYKSTKVPQQYTEDPQLGRWVHTQRFCSRLDCYSTSLKMNKLSDKRTELLNSINFV